MLTSWMQRLLFHLLTSLNGLSFMFLRDYMLIYVMLFVLSVVET